MNYARWNSAAFRELRTAAACGSCGPRMNPTTRAAPHFWGARFPFKIALHALLDSRGGRVSYLAAITLDGKPCAAVKINSNAKQSAGVFEKWNPHHLPR